MAKLVEILAKSLAHWPERVEELDQCAMGEIIERGNPSRVYCVLEKADYQEIVTRAQWEAERARILLENQPERDPLIKEITSGVSVGYTLERDYESEEVRKYEQELWDKVAKNLYCDWISIGSSTKSLSMDAEHACKAADAFMAERAKRLGATRD